MFASGQAKAKITRSQRILIVDDEEVVRMVIRSALDAPGTYLVEADTGEKAISLLLNEPFDLIIADKNLPGITGLDVLRRARKIDPMMGTLVITGYASRESAEEALAIGVDDYLVKPFELDHLLNKVRDSLDRRKTRKTMRPRSIPAAARNPAPAQNPGTEGTPRVILLDRDLDSGPALNVAIRAVGQNLQIVKDLKPVLAAIRNKTVSWIICDLDLLGQDTVSAGFLRSALILSPRLRFMAIASDKNLDGVIDAIHRGAHQVVYRPLPAPSELRAILKSFFDSSLKH